MPIIDIVKEHAPKKTFKNEKIVGQFDLSEANYRQTFKAEFEFPDDWKIGAIVGNSGTGKTTIAKQLFGDKYITDHKYTGASVVDDIDADVNTITRTFNKIGFNSPPSWLKPYHVLSNGEKMRVDLSRALLETNELIVFDEFTSVVDRQVASVISQCVNKVIKKQDKQFIAVGCHFDILDWLQPDWVLNTNDMSFFLTKHGSDQEEKYKSIEQIAKRGDCLGNITI